MVCLSNDFVVNTCTSCGAIISTGSSTCASCGAPQRTPSRGGSRGGSSAGGFCSACGTPLASKYSPCTSCGHIKTTFNPKQAGGGFCSSCGATLTGKYAPCPKCGYTKTRYNPSVPPQGALYKNEGTALILSIVLGIFGIEGIGQIYVGKVGRGIGILVAGIVLWVVGLVTIAFGVGIALLIGVLVLFIWQILDTKKLCREYNEFVSQNGRPPW